MLCMIRSGHDGTDPVSAAGVMKSVVRTAVWLMLALAAPAFGATVDYLHTDALGSVVAVSNSAGVVIERREYEPYGRQLVPVVPRSEEHTSELQSLMRISYAVFCLKKKKTTNT